MYTFFVIIYYTRKNSIRVFQFNIFFILFIQSYFDIPPDVRLDDDGNEEIRSIHYPLSEIARWITDAGMSVEGFHEPVVDPANLADAPYASDAWLEYAGMFARVPAVAVFICRKHP